MVASCRRTRMTGSEAAALQEAAPDWFRHANGRWVVEDAGRQAEVTSVPAAGRAGTRPDTIVDGGRLGRLDYRATSQRGLAHQEAGVPRQDAYLVRPTPDRRWLVGCVADGVSAASSRTRPPTWCARRRPYGWRAASPTCSRPGAGGVGGRRRGAALAGDRAGGERPLRRAASARSRRAAGPAQPAGQARESWDFARARPLMSSTALGVRGGDGADADDGSPGPGGHGRRRLTALLHDGDDWAPLTAVKNEGAEIASLGSPAAGPRPGGAARAGAAAGRALLVITDGVADPFGSGIGQVGRFLAGSWRQPPDLLAYAHQLASTASPSPTTGPSLMVWTGARELGADEKARTGSWTSSALGRLTPPQWSGYDPSTLYLRPAVARSSPA